MDTKKVNQTEMIFASRLKALREDAGLSQAELGRRVGLNRSSISKFESGNFQPSSSTLVLFARYFNVSADFLLGLIDTFKDDSDRRREFSRVMDALQQLPDDKFDLVLNVFNDLLKMGGIQNKS